MLAGARSSCAGSIGTASNFFPKPVCDTGEQWDAALGMYYLRARYCAPQLGRFWTTDSYEGSQSDPLSLHK